MARTAVDPAPANDIPVTNAIERRFREVRRRTRPMGTFQDRTSMDRILFAVFSHENRSQGVSTRPNSAERAYFARFEDAEAQPDTDCGNGSIKRRPPYPVPSQ
jgi:transposase-like protein